jgi:hypothetical protein
MPGNIRPIILCVYLVRTPWKTQFPLYFCHVLKGGVYRLSRWNDSSIVACIICRDNVYGYSSIVAQPSNGLFTTNLYSRELVYQLDMSQYCLSRCVRFNAIINAVKVLWVSMRHIIGRSSCFLEESSVTFPGYEGHGLVVVVRLLRKRRGMYSGLNREQERESMFRATSNN